jgi:hypothetical protein
MYCGILFLTQFEFSISKSSAKVIILLYQLVTFTFVDIIGMPPLCGQVIEPLLLVV